LHAELCGDDGWKWLPDLIGTNPNDPNSDGLLLKFASEFYSTIAQLETHRWRLFLKGQNTDSILRAINTFKQRQFIAEAARFGILPKYGFPLMWCDWIQVSTEAQKHGDWIYNATLNRQLPSMRLNRKW
jgi:hypothetical protein